MKIKGIIAVMAAAAVMASLCACTGTGSSSSAPSESSAASKAESTESKESTESTESAADSSEQKDGDVSELKAIFEKVKQEVDLPEDMADFTDKRMERVFDLTDAQMADYAGGVCTNGVSQDQIIYIKAKDEASVKEIEEKLKANWESKYTVTKNYNPEQAELFEKSNVETDGLYVNLVISADADKIKSIFMENLKN